MNFYDEFLLIPGAFDFVVIMAEPNSFVLAASTCIGAKNYPGLEQYAPDKFAPVLWLLQKRDTQPLAPEKLNLIDQKATQVLQRKPIARQIECGKGGPNAGPQGGHQGGHHGGHNNGGFGNNNGGFGDNNGGFGDNNQDFNNPNGDFNRPGGQNGPHGGTTVLKPGVTYVKPGQPGSTAGLQGNKQHHSNPEVNRLIQNIHNWFNDPRNKKNKQENQGGFNNGGFSNAGSQGGYFGGGGNGDDIGENDLNNFGGQDLGFRLGAGKTTAGPSQGPPTGAAPSENPDAEETEA
jgi:hypothetical protein